jgi:hypothetical protein
MLGAAGAFSTAGFLAGFFGAALRRAAGRFLLTAALFLAGVLFLAAGFFLAAVFLPFSPISVPSLAGEGVHVAPPTNRKATGNSQPVSEKGNGARAVGARRLGNGRRAQLVSRVIG